MDGGWSPLFVLGISSEEIEIYIRYIYDLVHLSCAPRGHEEYRVKHSVYAARAIQSIVFFIRVEIHRFIA